jgi:DNA-binding protein H-NS
MKKSLQALETEIARLQAEAEKLRNDEVQGVIDRIRVAIAHYGITADQLFGGGGGKRKAAGGTALKASNDGLAVGVPKYRDPASGKTWTGRGKPPAWIAGAADRAVFEIKGAAPTNQSKPSSTGKAGVPKYQDPATGKTWTGNGKPPAWIAGEADRTKFAINGSAAPSVARKSSGPARGGVPKYKDPATDKTWTGMGKPPAWIAGAPDRNAFLIAQGAGA